jgi:amidase
MAQFTSAIDARASVLTGEATSAELVRSAIELITTLDQAGYELNSVLAQNADALEQAQAIDIDGKSRPLEGLPILIKDNIEALGLPATAGSLALIGRPTVRDSTLVTRLREAGAVILGATNLSEWANIRSSKSTSGWSAVGGLTANPWIHPHSAGGSSSGAGAAIAAGIVPLVVGSETDGSIVCPASLNGCVGIKPTVGSVPRDGMIPISSSQDSPGPMGRSVRDVALLLEVMTAQSGFLAAAENQDPMRIGVVRSWLTKHDGTNARFEDSLSLLSAAGIILVEVEIPEPAESISDDEFKVLMHELHDDLGDYLLARDGDGAKSLRDVVEYNLANSDFEMEYFNQELFDQALTLGGRNESYREIRARNLGWAENTLAKALDGVDLLIGATYSPSWKSNLGGGDDYAAASWITTAPSIAGTPIGCLPMGIVDGLPVGMGVVSRRNDEANLVRAMSRIESALSLGVLIPTFRK